MTSRDGLFYLFVESTFFNPAHHEDGGRVNNSNSRSCNKVTLLRFVASMTVLEVRNLCINYLRTRGNSLSWSSNLVECAKEEKETGAGHSKIPGTFQ